MEEQKAQERKRLAEVVKSKEYQEQLHKEARLRTLVPWATEAGCAKCRYAVAGSTCCNPEKMLAKQLALDESLDGQLDKKLYEVKLNEIYEKLKAKHISPLTVTKLPEKGGGMLKDCYYHKYYCC